MQYLLQQKLSLPGNKIRHYAIFCNGNYIFPVMKFGVVQCPVTNFSFSGRCLVLLLYLSCKTRTERTQQKQKKKQAADLILPRLICLASRFSSSWILPMYTRCASRLNGWHLNEGMCQGEEQAPTEAAGPIQSRASLV